MPRQPQPDSLQPKHLRSPEPPPPPLDDFERLLGELSSEFERLRQQNVKLTRENSELRSAFPGHSRRVTQGSGTPDHREGQTSAWRAAKSVEPPEPPEPPRPPTLGAGTSLFGQSTASKQYQDVFSRMDVNDDGRLYQDDFKRVLQASGEHYDPVCLVNLVRSFNGMPVLQSDGGTTADATWCNDVHPDDGSAHHLDDNEDLGIDYVGFAHLMDDSQSFDNLGPGMQDLAASLRRACQKEQQLCAEATLRSQRTSGRKPGFWMTMWLETFPVIVILGNAIVTGFVVDYPSEEYAHLEVWWTSFEILFFFCYSLELATKLYLFGVSGYFCGSDRWWNLFDFACWAVSFSDLSYKFVQMLNSSKSESPWGEADLVKVFRLARLARPLRTLRFKMFHEVKLMVMGVFSGLRVLFWAIMLLGFLTYLIGVGMTNVFRKDEPEYSSVTVSMFTLFRCWTEGCASTDGRPLAETMRQKYGLLFLLFHVLTTMFVTVGVFNLIMAIFIDNVVNAQAVRRHSELGARTNEMNMRFKRLFTQWVKQASTSKKSSLVQLQSRSVRRSLLTFGTATLNPDTSIEDVWEELRGVGVKISREILHEWLNREEFLLALEDAEIETANVSELFEVLDTDMDGKLTMDELITGLMKLRGPVTKSDIVAVRLKVRYLTKMLEPDSMPEPLD